MKVCGQLLLFCNSSAHSHLHNTGISTHDETPQLNTCPQFLAQADYPHELPYNCRPTPIEDTRRVIRCPNIASRFLHTPTYNFQLPTSFRHNHGSFGLNYRNAIALTISHGSGLPEKYPPTPTRRAGGVVAFPLLVIPRSYCRPSAGQSLFQKSQIADHIDLMIYDQTSVDVRAASVATNLVFARSHTSVSASISIMTINLFATLRLHSVSATRYAYAYMCAHSWWSSKLTMAAYELAFRACGIRR